METLKKFNSNCAKIIAIAFICTSLSVSVFSQQGPPTVKYPDVNGQNLLQLNDIFKVGSILQVDNLLQFDTSWKGNGSPPKYYMVLSDNQGKFYQGPEKKLPEQPAIPKPDPINGGPPAGACLPFNTGWQENGTFVYLCPDNTRVGIGTSTPSQLLEVQGSGGTGGTNIYVNETGNAAAGIILDPGSGGTRVGMFSTGSSNNQGAGKLVFKNMADSTNPFVINLNNGHVGIGTTNPLEKFHVSGGNILLDSDFYLKSKRNGSVTNLIGVKSNPDPAFSIIEIGEPTTFPYEVRIYTPSDPGNGVSIHNGTDYVAFFRNDGTLFVSNEIVVSSTGWPDYVLERDYLLPDLLSKVKPDILKDHSLDGIPTIEEVVSKGIHLGDISKALVKKVEEIFLYLIEMKEEINAMMKDIFTLKNNDVKMQEEIDELKEENEMLKDKNIKMENDIEKIKGILNDLKKK